MSQAVWHLMNVLKWCHLSQRRLKTTSLKRTKMCADLCSSSSAGCRLRATLAATSITHTAVTHNCWWLSCIEGNVGAMFWPGRSLTLLQGCDDKSVEDSFKRFLILNLNKTLRVKSTRVSLKIFSSTVTAKGWNSASCCLLLVQVACVWAVTPRATPSVTGWTAWRTRAGGWSGGTSWPMSCHEPSAMTKPSQKPCRRSLSGVTWFTEILWLLYGTDLSNFTTGISSGGEGKCIIIRATMTDGEQGEAAAAWWCAFIIDRWVIQKKKLIGSMNTVSITPALSTRTHTHSRVRPPLHSWGLELTKITQEPQLVVM